MTRLVFAFLAVMALLVSPVTAAAAQAACNQSGPAAMADMGTSSVPGVNDAGVTKSGADPCCDHGTQHGKKSDANCAQACVTGCGVAVALTNSLESVVFTPTSAAPPPLPVVSRQPFEPPGLRRPPKSIA